MRSSTIWRPIFLAMCLPLPASIFVWALHLYAAQMVFPIALPDSTPGGSSPSDWSVPVKLVVLWGAGILLQ